MFDVIIENERKFFDVIELKWNDIEDVDVEVVNVLNEILSKEKKVLKRRVRFFIKVYECNVKLLFIVLNEVVECWVMVNFFDEYECVDSVMLEMEEIGRFLIVLKELNE